MEVASCAGGELFAVEFPQQAEIEKALARITSILRGFLPSPDGTEDRRVRRLPSVEAWLPRGAEAERLAGLGGIVPSTSPGVSKSASHRWSANRVKCWSLPWFRHLRSSKVPHGLSLSLVPRCWSAKKETTHHDDQAGIRANRWKCGASIWQASRRRSCATRCSDRA